MWEIWEISKSERDVYQEMSATYSLSGETLDENFGIPVYALSISPPSPPHSKVEQRLTDKDVLDGVLVASPRGGGVERPSAYPVRTTLAS